MPISVEGRAKQKQPPSGQRGAVAGNFGVPDSTIRIAPDMDTWNFNADSPNGPMDDFGFNNNVTGMGIGGVDNNFTWEMVGLGLEEPLPPQETIDEL